MSKNITIIGTGYVGLVSGTCFAQMGNNVMCLDVNEDKIRALKQGFLPIYEPKLDDIVLDNSQNGRLSFTSNYSKAITHGEIIFIAVDTPSNEDGSVDVRRVFAVADSIADYMESDKLIVNKSTSPVGTCEKICGRMAERLAKRDCRLKYSVASNPEFLREGCAVDDFMNPDRIVIGSLEDQTAQSLREIYKPLIDNNVQCVVTDPQSAELIKYASNTFLATKLAFINEISNLCECVEANIDDVSLGMGLDARIGTHFLKPSPGFGGSCFPKDMKALVHIGKENNCHISMISTAIESNRLQKLRAADKIERLAGGIRGKTIAVLGVAFKAETDDVRESPAVDIISQLISRDAQVRVFDPKALENAKIILGGGVYYAKDEYDAAKNADVVVVLTEWRQFKTLDFQKLSDMVKHKVLIDFRKILNSDSAVDAGFSYYCIGRSEHQSKNLTQEVK